MTAANTLVPELRFPEFRGDGAWAKCALGDMSTRIRKKVGSKVLTPVSITAGLGFVDQTAKFGRRIAGEQYKNYIHIKRGDFVYNKGNSKTFAQGCIYQLKEFDEAAASTAFICFKLDDRCVDQYFQNLFEFNAHGRELAKFITSGARSDGLLNISPDDFFSIGLPVPPKKPEQQKIADCLGSLDELIAAHSRKLATLQDHKKGLLQQLFPAEGETTPKLRFPEFEGAGEWKEIPLGEISKTTIGEFVIKTKQHPDAAYPVYNGGRSYTGFYEQYNNAENKIVISARGANAGHVNVVKQKYWAGNSCYSVSLIGEENNLDYVYWYIKHNQSRFTENQHAANIPSVNKGETYFRIRISLEHWIHLSSGSSLLHSGIFLQGF